MKLQKIVCVLLLFGLLSLPVGAQSERMHWYCTRQKAHRQAIAAPELRFVEELDGFYIDHTHNESCAEKVVYLTFDAGYENGNVEKVLDILKKNEVPAAFFVLKHLVEDRDDLLLRMNEEGHLVCNHTAHHPDLSAASKERIGQELFELEESCRQHGIVTAPYFRPPEGSFSREMLQSVRELGYKTVFWSFAYVDWYNDKQPAPQEAIKKIMSRTHPGMVALLHSTSTTNAEILPQIIAMWRERGYSFATLNELCATD